MTPSQTTARRAPARRRVWPHRLVALTLVLAGGAVTVWPVAEALANNRTGAAAVAMYVDDVAEAAAVDPAPLHADLARAQAYNASLSPAALWDPWGSETPALSPAHDAYLAQLATFGAMARLRIPQIDVDLPIVHDVTTASLADAVGHMYGTSLPVGGPGTHAVLAGHASLGRRTIFDRLPEVQLDQTFFIDVAGTTLTYRIDRITVVEPWELEEVAAIPGEDHVTLVTCYTPPGEHLQRLLVRGVRVPDAAPAGSGDAVAPATADGGTPLAVAPVEADASILGWMVPRLAVAGGAVALAVIMIVSWAVGDRRAARRAPAPAEPRIERPEPVGALR